MIKTLNRICKKCNKKFKARIYDIKKGYGKFCSLKCWGRYYGGKGKDNSNWKGGRVKRKCLKCDKIIKVFPSNKNTKFCSKKCMDLYRKTRKTVKCYTCGKRTEVYLADLKRIKTQRCCSQKCRAIKMSKIYIGNKAPTWQGGKSLKKYGSGFTNRKRNKIRERDEHRCQLCNKNLKYVKMLWDTHHIDYNKRNHRLRNLILLCRKCHNKTNFNRKFWEKYFKQKINEKYKTREGLWG